MSNRVLGVIGIFLIAFVLASPLLATTSRVNSLAKTGDYINDDSNVFRWYGVLPSYANLVMAEVGTFAGTATDQALGLTYSCGENGEFGTWGIFLLRNSVSDSSFFAFSPIRMGSPGNTRSLMLSDSLKVNNPVNKLALAWGKEFGNISMGLNLTRSDEQPGWWKNALDSGQTRVDTTITMSYTSIGAGVRADLADRAYADFAFTYAFAGEDTLFDKRTSISVAGRLFYEWKENATLVPLIEYATSEYSFKSAKQPSGSKENLFKIGIGMNIDVNTDNLLVFAIEALRYKWEYSDPGTDKSAFKMWALPTFYLALESNVKSWLTARVGAWKSLQEITETARTGTEDVSTDGIFSWFLGAGFHVAEFDIDLEVSPDLPFNVGYWITGYQGWGVGEDVPVGRISAIYHF